MFASWISGNTITNVPNASSALGYTSFYITAAYCQCYLGWSWVAPRVRRFSVARQWNSFSDAIADRFRNPAVIICLLIFPVCSLEAYIIAQQWACRALIPVVSDGNMHEDRMTLFLTTVVYICESFGGFDAVSYTDVIQGCIMIISLDCCLHLRVLRGVRRGILHGRDSRMHYDHFSRLLSTSASPSGGSTRYPTRT